MLRTRTRLFELVDRGLATCRCGRGCEFSSDAQLAQSVGVDRSTLWHIKNGSREIGHRFEARVVEWAQSHLTPGIGRSDLFFYEQVPDEPSEVPA